MLNVNSQFGAQGGQPESEGLTIEAENLYNRLLEQLGRLRKLGDALVGPEPTNIPIGKEQGQMIPVPLARYLRMHHELLSELQVQITRIEARI